MRTANPARSLLVCVAVLVAGGFVASTMGLHASATGQVTQGKLPVKLSEKFTLRFPNGTTGVAWAPDDSILAVSSNYGGKLNTYDAAGHPLHAFEANGNKGAYINSFAFINGASQLLFPVESSAPIEAALDIRDTATGRIVNTVTRTRDDNFSPNATDVLAVSPDQKHFAIGTGILQGFVVFSTDDDKSWYELSVWPRAKFGATSFSFFPDNRLLAVGQGDGHFEIVDPVAAKTLKEFSPYDVPGNLHTPNIYSIAVSPQGDMLLTGVGGGGITDKSGTVTHFEGASIWRVSDGTQIAYFSDPNKMIDQVSWDPKGRFVAFLDNNSLFIWRPDQSNLNFIKIRYPDLTASLALSRDGKSVAVAEGNKVMVYNIEDN